MLQQLVVHCEAACNLVALCWLQEVAQLLEVILSLEDPHRVAEAHSHLNLVVVAVEAAPLEAEEVVEEAIVLAAVEAWVAAVVVKCSPLQHKSLISGNNLYNLTIKIKFKKKKLFKTNLYCCHSSMISAAVVAEMEVEYPAEMVPVVEYHIIPFLLHHQPWRVLYCLP